MKDITEYLADLATDTNGKDIAEFLMNYNRLSDWNKQQIYTWLQTYGDELDVLLTSAAEHVEEQKAIEDFEKFMQTIGNRRRQRIEMMIAAMGAVNLDKHRYNSLITIKAQKFAGLKEANVKYKERYGQNQQYPNIDVAFRRGALRNNRTILATTIEDPDIAVSTDEDGKRSILIRRESSPSITEFRIPLDNNAIIFSAEASHGAARNPLYQMENGSVFVYDSVGFFEEFPENAETKDFKPHVNEIRKRLEAGKSFYYRELFTMKDTPLMAFQITIRVNPKPGYSVHDRENLFAKSEPDNE